MVSSHLPLLALLYIFSTSAASSLRPVLDLGHAKYRGNIDNTTNTVVFLGIRYAAAPTGDLRWAAPQHPNRVRTIIEATTQPPRCPQASYFGTAPTSPFFGERSLHARSDAVAPDSEDCLFLNVYTPNLPSEHERPDLPVLVWIHGGGYIVGSAALYNGQDLIDESKPQGFVVVVLQYRLGLFGFLSGRAVKSGGALNADLLDQEFALQWVQKHIPKFGGDPNRVTLWGESAGAGSVLQHVVAHNGETRPPLFHAAISSSMFLPSQYKFDDVIPESMFNEVVQRTNCSTSLDQLTCLRNTNVDVLQATNVAINLEAFFGVFAFVPVVDGTFIVASPTQLLARGKVNGKGLLAVTNTNEGTEFVNASLAVTGNTTAYVSNLFPLLNASQAVVAAAHYTTLGDAVTRANHIMSEAIFICPTYSLLDAFQGRSYKSQFAILPAMHGHDVPYYFPERIAGYPNIVVFNNTDFLTAFRHSFFNFVTHMDPNPAELGLGLIIPQWNGYSAGHEVMLFNKTIDDQPEVQSVVTSEAVLERCQFWRSVSEFIGQ